MNDLILFTCSCLFAETPTVQTINVYAENAEQARVILGQNDYTPIEITQVTYPLAFKAGEATYGEVLIIADSIETAQLAAIEYDLSLTTPLTYTDISHLVLGTGPYITSLVSVSGYPA